MEKEKEKEQEEKAKLKAKTRAKARAKSRVWSGSKSRRRGKGRGRGRGRSRGGSRGGGRGGGGGGDGGVDMDDGTVDSDVDIDIDEEGETDKEDGDTDADADEDIEADIDVDGDVDVLNSGADKDAERDADADKEDTDSSKKKTRPHFGKTQTSITLSIYGAGIAQGTLLMKIGQYSDAFEQCFSHRRLSRSDFQRLTVGTRACALVADLRARHRGRCTITFDTATQAVLLQGVDAAGLAACRAEFVERTRDLVHPPNVCCVCKSELGAVQLQICGCWYCDGCFGRSAGGDSSHDSDSGSSSSSSSSSGGGGSGSYGRTSNRVCYACQAPMHPGDFLQLGDGFQGLVDQLLTTYLAAHPAIAYKYCPGGCNGLLSTTHGAQDCPRCNALVCASCGVVDDALHINRTCADFQKHVTQAPWLKTAFTRADKFIRANWSPNLPPITEIVPNPCLAQGCLSLTRFLAAVGKKAANTADPVAGLNTFLSWHGSGIAGVVGICCEGFKPSYRSGQAYGPGEYFGVTPDISFGYCQGCQHMITTLIIRNQLVTDQAGFCHVVNNPKSDKGPCYCLPVAVVSFGGAKMSGFKH